MPLQHTIEKANLCVNAVSLVGGWGVCTQGVINTSLKR